MSTTVLITGGAGFIGSHLVRRFVKNYPEYLIINLDLLTYAGNLENLKDVQNCSNYVFEKCDITKIQEVLYLFEQYKPSHVIHLAAESHVDRSILDPGAFVTTNVYGTVNLLNAALKIWKGSNDHIFYHVSTDEVYGSLGDSGKFTENSHYCPHSPYAASKAASDHFVRAYYDTYGLPVKISNCSNNFGSHQFPEKLIPLIINNIKNNKPLPVYGDGSNVRDWLWVEDHASAIDSIFHMGAIGETFNVGGNNEWKNIDLVRLICEIMDEKLKRKPGHSAALIQFVKDRSGHDFRYAIDASKLKNKLGWEPQNNFRTILESTIQWYLDNELWLENITSGTYKEYYQKVYAGI